MPYVNYPNERVVAYIRDARGRIVASYEYKPLGKTQWFCAKIRTPDKEGIYAIDLRVYDQSGKQVVNPWDTPLVVSTELSSIGMVLKIIKFIEEHIFSRVDCLSNCDQKLSELITEIDYYVTEARTIGMKVLGKLREILYWKILDIKKVLENIKDKLDGTVPSTLDTIKNLLDEIRLWLRKRIT